MSARVVAPTLAEPMATLWHAAMDLYDAHPSGWTVVAGQMATLHSWERGTGDPRPTQDLDAGLNSREVPTNGVEATDVLQGT